MCGIAGVVSNDLSPAIEGTLRSMLPTMSRRGPNAQGLHVWTSIGLNAGFGHRRLAILDLSPAGAQPMLSPDGSVGVVFNGCIYNFREIRADLEVFGHKFRSQCDTEVLVEGFLEWGIDGLLSRIQGMFAFAVWDARKETLYIARDRLGVKPLIYCIKDGSIIFASTLRALERIRPESAIDDKSLLEFLDLGFVTEERSILAGTRKLPPGTLLEFKNGQAQERVYWSLPTFGQDHSIQFEDAVTETERLFVEAVRQRLISDVPIAALLSGGIDSTLVCWALAKLNANIRAFTVGMPGDVSDESLSAQEIAQRLGVPHEIIHLDPKQPPPLEQLTAAYSEPFAASSALGMLRVSEIVKPRATVLLTGDGGDDVYLGYPFFYNAWRAQRIARIVPGFTPVIYDAIRPALSRIPPLKRVRSFLDYSMGGIGAYGRVRAGFPYFRENNLFGERLQGGNVAYREVGASFESARNLVAEVFAFHKKMHFTSEFLTKVDGATMHYSLEARAPFLDQKIWEFASRIPPKIHFYGGRYKSVLRELVRRHVGPDVASRGKQGFTVPVDRWLANHWSSRLASLKDDTLITKQGWIAREPLRIAVTVALDRGQIPIELWHLLVLEGWLRSR